MIDAKELLAAIDQLSVEKKISADSIIEAIESALAAAYRKDFGEKNQNVIVELDKQATTFNVFDLKTVTDLIPYSPPTEEELAAQALADSENETEESKDTETKDAETEEAEDEEVEERFDPRIHLTVEAAQEFKPGAEVGDQIKIKLEIPGDFGRVAAQTAKQVVIHRLREAERVQVVESWEGKIGNLVNALVQRVDREVIYLELAGANGVLLPSEQVAGEHWVPGQRLKVIVKEVRVNKRGPEILVSRASTEMVHRIFEMEVPEIESEVIEIKAVAREAGVRTKIAVFANEENIDPIGSCVGQRGSRVQTIIQELGGEKIDIIEYQDDIQKFIAAALSPASVSFVEIVDEEEKQAKALVKLDQQSLAIGRGGQNVRLAAQLTGWSIDIVNEDGSELQARQAEVVVDETTEEVEAEKSKEETETDDSQAEEVNEAEAEKVADLESEEEVVEPVAEPEEESEAEAEVVAE